MQTKIAFSQLVVRPAVY